MLTVVRGWRRITHSRWLISFLLFSALGSTWALSTPIYGVPDEPSHVLRAASVARGQLVGERGHGLPGYLQLVRAPAGLVKLGTHPLSDPRTYIPCFVLESKQLPTCFGGLRGRPGLRRVPTDVGLDPPAFYGLVGLPSLVVASRPALTVYLMRLMSVLASAALLASALGSLQSFRPSWLGPSGMAFALTPTTLFLTGSVNPNGFEICAGIAAWSSVAALVHRAEHKIESRLVVRAAVAMIALALTRALSVLWLVLIVATALALATPTAYRRLAGSPVVRRWALAVIGVTTVAVAYVVVAGPLEHLTGHGPLPGPVGTLTIVRRSLGNSYDVYRQMIGVFGWLDTSSPAVTYLLWTAGLALLVGLCVAFASRRQAFIVIALAVLAIAVPVGLDTARARQVGIGWEGRWSLPFAVGVPIIAALAVAWSQRRALFLRSRLPALLAASFVIAQILGYGQYLRRNTVGVGGGLDFWLHAKWSPPLPAGLLLAANLAILIALAIWIWGPGDQGSGAEENAALGPGETALLGSPPLDD